MANFETSCSAGAPLLMKKLRLARMQDVFRIIGFDSHRASEIADELSEASSVIH
jgi:hypothetical protein